MENKQLTKRMARRGAAATGLTGQSDPYSDIFFNKILTNRHARVVEGIVARSGAGSYDVEVCVFGPLKYVCNMLVPCNSNTFGYSTAALPVEGTKVLVLIPDISTKRGYILGILPAYDGTTQQGQPGNSDTPVVAKRSLADDKTGLDFASSYTSPVQNAKYINKLLCNALRPVDMVPGEFAIQNENDCGLYCSMFSASITSGLAYLKASRWDDTVRISCRTFQQFSSQGSVQSYNDNGYIDKEEKVSIYQNERLGKNGLFGGAYQVSEEDEKGKNYYVQNKSALQTAKARIKSFVGFVGNLISKFVLRPDNTIDTLTMDSTPKDEGVSHINIDGSGTTRVRSVGGISLERYDRIPVPHRLKQAWDPEGDNEIQPQDLKPYNWDDDDKMRPVQLTDAIAWEHGQEYKRFDEHSNDFYTPEENDLNSPKSVYDPEVTASEPVDLEKTDKKRSGIFLNPDGSIVIRDNWGSEIVMSGGDITITAKEDIKITTPKSIAVLGKNVAVDADSGIDMAAESVTQYAEDNFFIQGRGILLDSTATNVAWANHKKGSDTYAEGITLRAKDSGVATVANYIHEHATENIGIITGDEERQGRVSISTEDVYIRGNSFLVNDNSLITNMWNDIIIYGESILNAAEDSWTTIRGNQILVAVWGDMKESPIAQLSEYAKSYYDTIGEYDWFAPFVFEDDLENRAFTFRSSQQADAMQIVFIQPSWDTTWSYDTSRDAGSYEEWEPFELEDVPDAYKKSWPGNDKLKEKDYATIQLVNIQDGISKARSSLVDKTEIKKKKVSNYPRTK